MGGWVSGLVVSAMLVAALAAGACGGDDDTPTSPSPPTTGGGTTITITSSGVNPKTLTVSPGTRVTFVNNDGRQHDMFSDPHPTHGSCPEIDQVGAIPAGQSRVSGNLNAAGTCSYHDHGLPTNTGLQGTIRIQ